jgi:peptide/nickel transport system permease protein
MSGLTADSLSVRTKSSISAAFKIMIKNPEMLFGFAVVAVLYAVAITVGISEAFHFRITPYDPITQNVGPMFAVPSLSHLFGTDYLGRDVFSRVISATPNDVGVALVVEIFAVLMGEVIGSLAAFKGGLIDEILMRFTDVFFALPTLVLAMAIAYTIGPGIIHMALALSILWWPSYARLARGEALRVTHQNYIKSAKLAGLNTRKIILKHIIPNSLVTVLVYATLDMGTVILTYSGLSYLGLSVRPPQPDWGEMVSGYQMFILTAPWLPIIPALIIAIGVVGFSLLGDGMRDALEMR